MEHYSTTHYLMWKLKGKLPFSMNSFISPWEEQKSAAIQEPFGGFIWPPRTYTCSFCRREFRSAQALGGHMNIHRRDRARLKQSSPPQQSETGSIRHHRKHTSGSHQEPVTFSAEETWQVHSTIFTPFLNSQGLLVEENRRGSGKPGLCDDECNNNENLVETKLSMGLELVSRGNLVCKRHKKNSNVSSPLSFVSKVCSSDRRSSSSASMEDIDLELRLGDSPAVK